MTDLYVKVVLTQVAADANVIGRMISASSFILTERWIECCSKKRGMIMYEECGVDVGNWEEIPVSL